MTLDDVRRGPTKQPGLLTGLRIIEVSAFVAAPLSRMSLAQPRADLVRVDPSGGAPDRQRWPLDRWGASLFGAGIDKGKKSMTVDFRSRQGRQVIRRLAGSCPPGTAVVLTNAVGHDRLSYESLSVVRPASSMSRFRASSTAHRQSTTPS